MLKLIQAYGTLEMPQNHELILQFFSNNQNDFDSEGNNDKPDINK